MAFQSWLAIELTKLLGIDEESSADISAYVSSFKQKEDVVTFVTELLGNDANATDRSLDAKQREFLRQTELQWEKIQVPENMVVYKRDDDTELKMPGKNLAMSKNKNNPFSINDESDVHTGKKGKKKQTYVSLYGKDGKLTNKGVIIPGRNPCECQAQKHKLVNNCLKCGRVVCEQEGSGPCLFCGNLVCTREEKEILARHSNKSEKLHKKLMSVPGPSQIEEDDNHVAKALEKARAYKNRLLKYDRTCAQRTRVIDDESDYFAADTNIWLGDKERELMKKKEAELWEKKHGSRLNKKVTLDFAGRRVIEDDGADYNINEDVEIMDANFKMMPIDDPSYITNIIDTESLVNPTIKGPKPMFVQSQPYEKKSQKQTNVWPSGMSSRLQDPALLEMSDPGMCLSMHQPWASLLVRGIKKDEGRSWYSKHRGRLWIAAAARPATKEEIEQLEQQHEVSWRQQNPAEAEMAPFPAEYPVGCLLGCVHVKDVLEQEDYARAYPYGESGSPYVFVCENPKELRIKFPVKGKHKIWKLDPTTHRSAKKALKI
uniref:Activating signal cointegrator 1-like n=1 Tax=Phallusia mammillata TaxID=59560 RepID=A0A6F9D7R4_9ASCI|nr:activating signal cointegrator 1-like [Phallusia mammillata]